MIEKDYTRMLQPTVDIDPPIVDRSYAQQILATKWQLKEADDISNNKSVYHAVQPCQYLIRKAKNTFNDSELIDSFDNNDDDEEKSNDDEDDENVV